MIAAVAGPMLSVRISAGPKLDLSVEAANSPSQD
jgi:hypothetical protein